MPGNDLFRQIADSARHFAIVSTDVDGRITYANPAVAEVLGWQPDELAGQPLSCIYTPEDIAAGIPRQEMAQAREQGYGTDECWHVRRGGERFWASGEVTPLKDAAGRVCGYAKILQDRTPEKTHALRQDVRAGQLAASLASTTRERDRLWTNSLDLMLEIDPQGIVRGFNPAGERLLGYTEAELVGRHFAPYVHPQDVARTAEAILQASQGPLVHFEVRILHKAGGYRDFAWTAAPGDGLIYANGRDITTEKRQADLLNAHTKARLRMALEAGRMGAWEWDMRTGQVLLLDGGAALHGLDAAAPAFSFASMDEYAALVHPDDRAHVGAVVRAAAIDGGEHRLEYRVLPPGKPMRWLEVRGTVLLDEHGRPSAMHGVSTDISARKQAEQDQAFLDAASGELAALVDLQATIDKVVRLAVPNFADWCAIDLVQDGKLVRLAVAHVDAGKVALAHDLHRRYPPKQDDAGGSWRVVQSGQPNFVPRIDTDVVRRAVPEPERRDILLALGLTSYIGVPLISHNQVMGVATFMTAESGRIYTERDLRLAMEFARRAAIAIDNAQLYQAVQQADRDKDVFLATLSHELRNPLAALSNAVSLLGLHAAQHGHDRRNIGNVHGVMQRQVGQLSRLVDDLLDIARIATGKIALRREPVRLATVIHHAVEASRPMIEARRHQLGLNFPEHAIEVHGDAARLTQVFANLLSNAAKFTPEGGRIAVDVGAEPGWAVVTISDTGIGIEPDLLPKLFQLFAQGRQLADTAAPGLGIGLSLVERLVQLHGGTVTASSAGPGQGSTFVVRLPVVPARADASGRADGAPRALNDSWWNGRHVLVVDDNVDAAATLGTLLQAFGADVQVVNDGPAALAAVDDRRPDVMLLDIGMPLMDGLEVARRVRGGDPGRRTLLIALTGWGQAHDRDVALAAGFDLHWVKPVTLAKLQSFNGAADG